MKIPHKTLAALCDVAYLDRPEMEAKAKAIDFPLIGYLDRNDTQAGLFYNEELDEFVLAFRGTEFLESWTDFFRNIGWLTNWAGPGKVHRGYLRGYQMIMPDVQKIARDVGPNLTLTGHSLGGSTATIAACHLNIVLGNRYDCVTFGAPPAVNWDLACQLDIVRYFIKNDFAPMIPGQMVGIQHPVTGGRQLPKHGRFPASIDAHWIPRYRARV